jgi:osmotically-inducible protein OsmY
MLVSATCLALLGLVSACSGDKPAPPSAAPATNEPAKNAAPAKPSQSPEDAALESKVKTNLEKAGVSGVTVAVANGEVTLGGDCPAAKWQDAMKAANDAAPKKVINNMVKK